MLRWSLGSVVVVMFMVGSLLAADAKKDESKNTDKHAQQAKIVNVNPQQHTVTVKMRDKEGKEMERTFHLTEDVTLIDDTTGKVAALDVFQSGNDVLVVEGQGRLRELHKAKSGHNPAENKDNKSKESKPNK